MLRQLDALVFGTGSRLMRQATLYAADRGWYRTARAADWSAQKIWTMGGKGYWNSTKRGRKMLEGWRPSQATINRAMACDLPTLVAQLRELERVAPAARGVVEGRKAELVGTGIGIAPNTGDTKLDEELQLSWDDACRRMGLLGESLWELQRIASGEIDVAGSVLWRGLVLPERVSQGLLPWCILSLPAEWMSPQPVRPIANSHQFVAGIEADRYGRALFAHIRNPDALGEPGEVIELGEQAKHIFERRWSLQANGTPRLDTLVERLMQDDEIISNEMKASRILGSLAVIVNDDVLREAYLKGELPDEFIGVDSGTVSFVGERSKISAFTHDRPSVNTAVFRENTKGDFAGGAQVSRVWADRDGSKYNLSNSRFDQMRTQMIVKPAQGWFGDAVASWPYTRCLPYMLAGLGRRWPSDRAEQRKLLRHELVPDIPPELDEKASAQAFAMGNQAGIASRADYLSGRGKNPKAIAEQIDREAADDARRAIARITEAQKLCDKANAADTTGKLNLHWSHIVTVAGAKTAPGAYLQAANPQDDAQKQEGSNG